MTHPRHTPLAQSLAEGIRQGRLAVGSLLPTELELCVQHKLSRYAVRKALDELQELGLISRKKNVGTRVEAAKPPAGFTQSIATADELAQFGATHTRVVQSVEEVVVDLSLAQTLGCPGGTRWQRISSLRLDGGASSRPMGWTDVYVDAAYTDIGELARAQPKTLISAIIDDRYGRAIARIQQAVQGALIDRHLGEVLRADVGSPALRIVRRYLDSAGEAFEISVSIHPADRFTLSMQMDRTKDLT